MKKFIVALGTVALLGSSGAVLADNHKDSICHNGSTYNSGTQVEDPISFVITIAGKSTAKAVNKHVANHGDLETWEEDGTGEECELGDDGLTVECNDVMFCKELSLPI